MNSIGKEVCPYCKQSINERKISLFWELIPAIAEVYKYCKLKEKDVFTRKEVKHLFKSENVTARFGDLVYFGRMIEKAGKRGEYRILPDQVRKFMTGEIEINTVVWKNPITNKYTRDDYRSIDEIPKLRNFLDYQNTFVSEYRNNSKAEQSKLF